MDSLIRIIDGEPTSGWFFKDTPKEKWRKVASLKSLEAAKQLAINAKSAINMIDEICECDAYKDLGFDSFQEFLEKRIRITPDQFKLIKAGLGILGPGLHTATACETAAETMRRAEAIGPHRRPKAEEVKVYDVNFNQGKGGNRGSYLAARIKRDRPDIAERVEAGEFPSMRAAAIAAGIIRQKSIVEKALALVKKMTEAERLEFKAHLEML